MTLSYGSPTAPSPGISGAMTADPGRRADLAPGSERADPKRPPSESPPEAIERAIDDVARTIDTSGGTNPTLQEAVTALAARLADAVPR